ncbi:MAG TPA: F0F1 ATP synthase subunit B [Bacteroidota bacterium]|nr:F0F1 ATP synthase subunit B [Bacteroidota bacterium]
MLVQPDPGLIIWTIITFLLLLFILKKAAWKPLLSALQKREDTIASSLQKAEQAKVDAEKLLKEHSERLAQAEAEAQRIINEGRQLAEKIKENITAEAKAISDKIIKESKEEIEKSRQAAIESLKKDISQIAILAASKIISENLDEKVDKKLVDKMIDNLPETIN